MGGDTAPHSPRRGRSPQFSAHVYCGRTAACIKMQLGTEVGLGPDDIVLDKFPAPLPKKGRSPLLNLRPILYCGRTAGCIKMPLGMEVGLSLGDFVIDGDPAPLSPKRGRSTLPNFRPMSIVAKLLDVSRWHLAWRWALVQATLC